MFSLVFVISSLYVLGCPVVSLFFVFLCLCVFVAPEVRSLQQTLFEWDRWWQEHNVPEDSIPLPVGGKLEMVHIKVSETLKLEPGDIQIFAPYEGNLYVARNPPFKWEVATNKKSTYTKNN